FAEGDEVEGMLSYGVAVWAAGLIALASVTGVLVRSYVETRTLVLSTKVLDQAALAFGVFLWLAVLVVTAVNLVTKSVPRRRSKALVILCLATAGLAVSIVRFLRGSLSLSGWPVQSYAILLAIFLGAWGFCVLEPFLRWIKNEEPATAFGYRRLAAAALLI